MVLAACTVHGPPGTASLISHSEGGISKRWKKERKKRNDEGKKDGPYSEQGCLYWAASGSKALSGAILISGIKSDLGFRCLAVAAALP